MKLLWWKLDVSDSNFVAEEESTVANVLHLKFPWTAPHWQPLRLLVRVIYGELMLDWRRVCAHVYARVFWGVTGALHHPLTFLSPPLSWPLAWVNAEAPSLHLLATPFVCQPSPSPNPSPSYPSFSSAHSLQCKLIIPVISTSQLNSI